MGQGWPRAEGALIPRRTQTHSQEVLDSTLLYSRCAIAGDLADCDGREGHSGAERPQVPFGLSRLLLRILSAHREAEPVPLAASVPDGDARCQLDGAQ